MSSEIFEMWARDFDHRLRFGIPNTPLPKGEAVPNIVTLPPRANAFQWPEEDVTATLELLAQCTAGQAVALSDPEANDNTARRKAELMKDQIMARGADVIATGWKLRGHVITAGDPTTEEKTSDKTGKTYKVVKYPQNTPAISLVPESEPDEPEPNGEPPADPPAGEPATTGSGSRRRGG